MGNALQQTPEDRLGKRSPTPCFLPFAPTLCLYMLRLQPVHEDGFQGAAEGVRVPIVTGDNGIRGHVLLLQRLDGIHQLLLDQLQDRRDTLALQKNKHSGRFHIKGLKNCKARAERSTTQLLLHPRASQQLSGSTTAERVKRGTHALGTTLHPAFSFK